MLLYVGLLVFYNERMIAMLDTPMVLIWGIVLVGTLILEIMTVQMVSIWFSCSSLCSLILACIGAPRWAQTLVFAAMTAFLLIMTRPVVKKLKKTPSRTNADLNIGKSAVITQAVHNELSEGRAVIGGVSWIAVSADGSPIESGEVVKVMDIDGAKLIVSKNAS